jgi:hypothetical protein
MESDCQILNDLTDMLNNMERDGCTERPSFSGFILYGDETMMPSEPAQIIRHAAE